MKGNYTELKQHSSNTISSAHKFLALFLPNVVLQMADLVYEYFIVVNADVRGWWPLALVFIYIMYGALAGIYVFIDKFSPSDRGYTYTFAVLWIIPFVIVATTARLYPVDWLAVNNGVTELTTMQTLGDYEPIYFAVLLAVHALMRLYQRQNQR